VKEIALVDGGTQTCSEAQRDCCTAMEPRNLGSTASGSRILVGQERSALVKTQCGKCRTNDTGALSQLRFDELGGPRRRVSTSGFKRGAKDFHQTPVARHDTAAQHHGVWCIEGNYVPGRGIVKVVDRPDPLITRRSPLASRCSRPAPPFGMSYQRARAGLARHR